VVAATYTPECLRCHNHTNRTDAYGVRAASEVGVRATPRPAPKAPKPKAPEPQSAKAPEPRSPKARSPKASGRDLAGEGDPVQRRPVVVLDRIRDGEPHRPVVGDGCGVLRGGDRLDDGAPVAPRAVKELLVQAARQPGTAPRRRHREEVNVGLPGPRSRHEADEEARELPVMLGDQAGIEEMVEEQPG
jgi:hypothetical protein